MILTSDPIITRMRGVQARDAYDLRADGIIPKLVIIRDSNNHVINKYVTRKIVYGREIGVEVQDCFIPTDYILHEINRINRNPDIHGVIVQLPILEPNRTESIVGQILPSKDVDGLSDRGKYSSATATAIDLLLAGYHINLKEHKIAIVGYGKLVGEPLAKMWRERGIKVEVFRKSDGRDLKEHLPGYSLIVSATGVPNVIKDSMISDNSIVIDAGTASEHGVVVGDVEDKLRERRDVSITPRIGGVGPLTVASLFANVLHSAQNSVKS